MAARSDRLELLLLRHADAGDSMAWTRPDAERPLSPKGQRQAARVARWLLSIDHRPDAIITSPKVRAAETAAVVADVFGMSVVSEPRLAGALDVHLVEEILRDAGGPSRPMLVGHDPDFSELAAFLSGLMTLEMRKGALVRIDLVPPLDAGGGTLRWLVPPDALPGD
ncbi:MAG TPA: histidine phosphatase family protein [Candidatus Limnocylindrales bacterium]